MASLLHTKNAVSATFAQAGAPTIASRAPSVLIIDESRAVRNTLVSILSRLLITEEPVIEATSARDAQRLFARHAPTLVFTELIGVHPQDGLDIVHAMLERDPDAKIVIVTSEPDSGPEVREAVRIGAFAVVTKPLRLDKIRRVLEDLDSEGYRGGKNA